MAAEKIVVIREYDPNKDRLGVEQVEKKCEVGPSGQISLFTDLLGDPICRVRYSPAFLMLVAEIEGEIVGMIRGCIKTVTCGKKLSRNGKNTTNSNNNFVPVYTKVAYILGLRVSPSHRRMKIGLDLVQRMEKWSRENGAEYSYMATENDNIASINLFTNKCGYTEFRTPSILVNPVFAHRVKLPTHRVTIIPLDQNDAEALYKAHMSTTAFFPHDIHTILNNKLNMGTFVAVPCGTYDAVSWPGAEEFLKYPPESWAVLSVWNCKFKLELRGASRLKRAIYKTTRLVDRALPWLRVPSVPEIFRPFGLCFLYGLDGQGPRAAEMVKALCGHAHNVAKECGCAVVATEVAGSDPLREGVPYWKSLSGDDLWCVKRLVEEYSDECSVGDWTKSAPEMSIFVDPREF